MASDHRFIVSFIANNQPQSMEIFWNSETLPMADAENLVKKSFPGMEVTDIRITGLHRENNPHVHPGHYQQPEG